MKKLCLIALTIVLVCSFAACRKFASKYDVDSIETSTTVTTTTAATTVPEPVVEIDYSSRLTGTYVNSSDFSQYFIIKAMTDGTYLVTYGEGENVLRDMTASYENGRVNADFEDTYPDYPGYISVYCDAQMTVEEFEAGSRSSKVVGTYNEKWNAEKVSDSVDVKMVFESLPVNNNAASVHFFEQVEVRDIVPNDECLPLITLYNDNTFDFWCNMYYGMIPLRGVWFEGKQGNDTTYYLTVQYSNYMNQYHPLTYDEFSVHDFRLSTVTGTDQVVFSASGQSICFGMTGEDGAGYDSFKIIY